MPRASARIRLAVRDGEDVDVLIEDESIRLRPAGRSPDAVLSADSQTWSQIATDVRGGMKAFRAGRLSVRGNLHLGVGLLAATAEPTPGRLRFDSVATASGRLATASAGEGPPLVCLHGLGATKASFLPTLAALADTHRVIAVDMPGFGDSGKPLRAAYDAPFFARSVVELLDALELDRADFAGNSMGGRVAIELGFAHPDRVGRLVLLSPALAWLRDRSWARLLGLPLPKLALLQPNAPALTDAIVRRLLPGGSTGWSAAGVDEFLRAFRTPRGRHAFYESARRIYLDEPHGDHGFWKRLANLEPDALFVWGRQDTLVPIAFRGHVEKALPSATHLELDCGHVPQLEAPEKTHRAMREFLRT